MKPNPNEDTLAQKINYQYLILGIFFDAIGMLSFTIPLLGEFSDVIWAPISSILLTKMYKGKNGKIMGIVAFLEEIIPFTDFIPTFTITWIYTYLISKNKKIVT